MSLDGEARIKAKNWLEKNDPLPLFLKVISQKHVGDEPLAIAHVLAAHSISLADSVNPVHLYTIGKSGKGKGHVANSVLRLFKDSVKMPLASFSPKAFFYIANEEGGFDGKIIHAPEVCLRKDDAEQARSELPELRRFWSENRDRYLMLPTTKGRANEILGGRD